MIEENVIVYPPNRPLQRTIMMSKAPVLYEYLYFIDINEKGEAVVGCSNLSGTYWEGSLFYYRDTPSIIKENYSHYYISPSTTADAKLIKNSNHIILAEDTGCLRLLNISDDFSLKCEDYYDYGAKLEQISLWDNGHKFVTCSENALAIWNLQNFSLINQLDEYRDYHIGCVTSVDTHKTHNSIFASASLDRKSCIWDERNNVIASVLYVNEFCGLTSVAWNPLDSNHIAVGNEAGDVYLLDIRKPKDFVDVHNCFNNKVHHIAFNKAGKLAVCGDTSKIIILNCEKTGLKKHNENMDHNGFVRGLAWSDTNVLYSCGFDKLVIKHNI